MPDLDSNTYQSLGDDLHRNQERVSKPAEIRQADYLNVQEATKKQLEILLCYYDDQKSSSCENASQDNIQAIEKNLSRDQKAIALIQKRKQEALLQGNLDRFTALQKLEDTLRDIQANSNPHQYGPRYDWRGRLDHYDGIEELPQTIHLVPVKGEYYYNGKLSSDFRYELKSYSNPNEFIDGIQKGERATMELTYKKRIIRVDIEYAGEYLYFYSRGRAMESIFLSPEGRGKVHRVNFGDNIRPRDRGKKKGSFVELFIRLDWR